MASSSGGPAGVAVCDINIEKLFAKCLSQAERRPDRLCWLVGGAGEVVWGTGKMARRVPPEPDSHDVGVPLAAFEVLSPSTRRRDRRVKAAKLLSAGVEEVWLVDPELRAIEIRTSAGTALRRGADAAVSDAVPGLSLVPADLFGGI